MAGSTVPSFSTALVALIVFGLRCARAAVPLEVYGHLPQLEDVALSPNGERAALIQTQGDHRFIVIESLTEHKMLKVIAAGDQKVRSIRWADDDHLMIVTSMTLLPEGLEGHRGEWYTLQVYDVARGTKRIVPNLDEEHRFGTQATVMNVVVGDVQIRTIDGHTVLFVPGLYASDTDLLRALFRVDLQNNQTTLMLKGNREARDWLIDQSGQLAARFDYDSEHRQWQVGIRQGGKWVDAAISGQEAIDIPELQGFTNDSNAVLMRVVDHGKAFLRPLDLQQGKLGDALPLQGQTVIYDRTTDRMLGASLDDGTRYRFLDAAYQGHWDAIMRAYAGEQVHLISFADGFQKAVISVEGARDGFAYVIIDLAAKRAFPIGDIYQGLPQLMPVKAIEYPAADGLKIPAYLTLPSGRDPKALALVVLPHGGPATHEDGSFDWWSQALASQGYAVLQPNFRGSTLGWDFMSAGFGEVGHKMQTDLSDGVHYLVEQGIVDPKRVCIVGASYGGYAALAGVSLFPGIYRCAVSVAGMSDLSRMMKFDDEFGYGEANRTTRYWDRFLGVHGATDPVLDSISPLKHVKSVDVPVLMIHGTDDTVVAFEQSQDMYKALTQLGKPVELIRLNHEDHWLSSSDTRLQMLQATVDFLRKHSPPD